MSEATMAAPVARIDGDSFTHPADWYTSDAQFALEDEQIFRRTWQYVGLVSAIPNVGDYFTYQVGRVPVFVIRASGGAINAFANVCPHRAAELLSDECGTRSTIQCPYHAWTFDLDGALRKAPRADNNIDFDAAGVRLISLQAQTLGPLIFANMSADADPLEDTFEGWLAEIDRAVDPSLKLHGTVRYEVDANWKVVTEGAFECYHCPTVHRNLATAMDVNEDLVFEFRRRYAMRQLLARKEPRATTSRARPGEGRAGTPELHVAESVCRAPRGAVDVLDPDLSGRHRASGAAAPVLVHRRR